MTDDVTERTLSHGHAGDPLPRTVARLKDRIRARGDLPHVTFEEQARLVDDLAGFPFGRFLLQNRGWNGCWTDYAINHPTRGRLTGVDPEGRPLTDLERTLLDTFPTVLATQQRARHFEAALQLHVRDGAVLASVPCGLMRDLLGLDFAGVAGVRLVGIDIDAESLAAAGRLAEEYGLSASAAFERKDAWNLSIEASFDVLTSNGLNIYEADDARVEMLYRQFFAALRPGGVLVTSFLTPPPEIDPTSEWDTRRIDPAALRLQRIVFVDILDVRFQCYRTASVTRAQLQQAGFATSVLSWDDARIFPTVVASKAGSPSTPPD